MTSNTTDVMERRRIVADAIRAETLMKFDMSSWGEIKDCGTAGCIAGYAVAIFDNDMWSNYLRDDSTGDIEAKAAEILGLSEAEVDGLFVGEGYLAERLWPNKGGWSFATPDQAADALLSLPAPAEVS